MSLITLKSWQHHRPSTEFYSSLVLNKYNELATLQFSLSLACTFIYLYYGFMQTLGCFFRFSSQQERCKVTLLHIYLKHISSWLAMRCLDSRKKIVIIVIRYIKFELGSSFAQL